MTPQLRPSEEAPHFLEFQVERLLVRLRSDLHLVLDLAVVDLATGVIQATLGSGSRAHQGLCRAVDRCLEAAIGLRAVANVWRQVSGEQAEDDYDEVVLTDSEGLSILLHGRHGLGLVAMADSQAPLGLVLARLREAQREFDRLARENGP